MLSVCTPPEPQIYGHPQAQEVGMPCSWWAQSRDSRWLREWGGQGARLASEPGTASPSTAAVTTLEALRSFSPGFTSEWRKHRAPHPDCPDEGTQAPGTGVAGSSLVAEASQRAKRGLHFFLNKDPPPRLQDLLWGACACAWQSCLCDPSSPPWILHLFRSQTTRKKSGN